MNVLMMHIVALQYNGQREQRSCFHLYKNIQSCLLVFKHLSLDVKETVADLQELLHSLTTGRSLWTQSRDLWLP